MLVIMKIFLFHNENEYNNIEPRDVNTGVHILKYLWNHSISVPSTIAPKFGGNWHINIQENRTLSIKQQWLHQN